MWASGVEFATRKKRTKQEKGGKIGKQSKSAAPEKKRRERKALKAGNEREKKQLKGKKTYAGRVNWSKPRRGMLIEAKGKKKQSPLKKEKR